MKLRAAFPRGKTGQTTPSMQIMKHIEDTKSERSKTMTENPEKAADGQLWTSGALTGWGLRGSRSFFIGAGLRAYLDTKLMNSLHGSKEIKLKSPISKAALNSFIFPPDPVHLGI